ncbi:DNA primase [Mangrovibrevibacter kandeliae]|uniref:DNA primase n=1 Tax=Mangrovibrevibacter kandeliae TaxID=2968473 RepID=UPI002118FFA0|nr:DNA primase [Aurantimonas sp. CSK15Z-1]MCQ8784120.1 DNA primase [Aurantimonas sp. CSK15Z-1]
MKFPPTFLDDIRQRVPISEVIGRRVTFDRRKSQPARGDFWACCPFHSEKSPSFHCEDAKGRYHCFGCGVSGDHFRFLTEAEGLSFPEAVERLAADAGLAMPARDPDAERREKQRATVMDALRLAAEFFQAQLQEADGSKARAYLRDRGLNPATQKAFGMGFAPDSRNRLKEFLAGRGVGKAEMEAAGLVVHGPDIPVSYDRFRDRVMFPIRDLHDKAIAFGGRALQPGVPAKYLNSPETEVFSKGSTLFNLANARRAAKAAGTLLVVEGYMDVIALAQAGFGHAVAPLGTALTERQLELLWRSTGEPVLCFDGDAAGTKAAYRAAEIALRKLAPGRSLRFALLPGGQDPDDLVRAGGPDAFAAVLQAARPLADLLWMRETASGVFDTPERRADLERRLKDLVRQVGDESVRRHYLQDVEERLRGFFGTGPSEPRRRGDGGERGERGRFNGGGRPRGGAAGRRAMASDRLVRSPLMQRGGAGAPSLRETAIVIGFINHPTLFDEAFDYFADVELPHGELDQLRSLVLDIYADSHPADRDELLETLERRGGGTIFEKMEAKVRLVRLWPFLPEAAPEDAREAVRQALHLHHRFLALHRELRMAEEALGQDPTEAVYAHMIEVKREIESLSGMEALVDGFGVLSGRPAKSI